MYPSIESSVSEIFNTAWSITDGYVVPQTEDVVLKNGGKRVTATWLYADLAESTKLAQTMKQETTARIVRAYVGTATRILRKFDGEIRSFDGDRVMAIFMGSDKNDRAVRAAFGINWAVHKVIAPAIDAKWNDVSPTYRVNHGIGIDTGEGLIVRGGVRDNNDLISIGTAPNDAARLSEYRSYAINISDAVYTDLSDSNLRNDAFGFWTSSNGYSTLGNWASLHHSDVWWAV